MILEAYMRFRIYVDETGNSGKKSLTDPNNQYLSLTGVIFEEVYARTVLEDKITNLKNQFFSNNEGTPVILHRSEIINKRGPFKVFKDPDIEQEFNRKLLQLLNNLEYKVITVVIDKHEHINRYTKWQAHPYHYCLEVILERFIFFLDRSHKGDLLFEARSKKQDKQLNKSYGYYFQNGTRYKNWSEIQECITSKQLKLRPKYSNIAGLQVADLIAHPSFIGTKATHLGETLPNTFGAKIYEILERDKYYRSPMGRIDGYGRKWLP